MGLNIKRRYGEGVTLEFPDHRTLTVTRVETPYGDVLDCYCGADFLWRRPVSYGEIIGVDDDAMIDYRPASGSSALLVVTAPQDVLIYMTEQPRTRADREVA